MSLNIQIKRLRNVPLPAYATNGSAAMDLCAAIDAPVTLLPHKPVMIPTGIAIALPSADCAALVYARSGLAAKQGIAPVNAVGVIDSDYRGEISVALINHSDTPATIEPGQRIAQLLISPVLTASWQEVDTLPASDRGSGGFGSTGK